MVTESQIFLIAEVLLVWFVLTMIQYPLRNEKRRVLRTIVFILKNILILATAFVSMGIEWPGPYLHNEIFCAVYIALIADVIASIVEYIVRRIRSWKKEDDELRHRFDHRIGVSLGLTLCLVVLLAGTVNSQTIVMDSHEWQADGLEQEHTFAFASDLHISTMTTDGLRKLCRQVEGSDAEFLILGGDITDELTSYDQMIETYRILSALDIPIYMVYGNHERQPSADFVGGRTYSDQQLLDAIEGAGITLLVDEYVQIADDLVLLGREDMSVDTRKDWSELKNPYDKGALIIADHQPFDKEQLRTAKGALQLSGHLHGGELWPLQTIGNLLGYHAYGEYDYPGIRLYVTPGASDWIPAFRTEGHSGWELITLHP